MTIEHTEYNRTVIIEILIRIMKLGPSVMRLAYEMHISMRMNLLQIVRRKRTKGRRRRKRRKSRQSRRAGGRRGGR